MYQKIPGRVDIDGIIAIDTHVLVSTIKILNDEVQAAGITFTTKEDKRCNCPQVIYTLEDNISRPVNYVKSGRKDLLGALLYAIMEKALKSSPKLYWGPLFQDMIAETAQKHILFDINDKNAQDGIVALNAAGKIKTFDGDYLHISDANLGGRKSNLYVTQEVAQKVEVAKDGSMTKTLTITYKNPQEYDGWLNSVLPNWTRVYVPEGSELIDSEGFEDVGETYTELGKTVFSGGFELRPQGVKKIVLTYKLPHKMDKNYNLLIQKQPGTDAPLYSIEIGKKSEEFYLRGDKEVEIKI